MKKTLFRLFVLSIGLAALYTSGCGYTLHGKSDIPIQRIAIGTIDNKTFEPKLQDKLNRTLTDVFLEYSIEVDPLASRRIDGKISRYEMRVLSEKNLVASQYEVIIVASFSLTDLKETKTVFLGEISSPFAHYFSSVGAMENVLSQKDITTERALRDLSQELARRIIYAPLR